MEQEERNQGRGPRAASGPGEDHEVIAGRYCLFDRMDTGGAFSDVFIAEDLLTSEEVAVKLLPTLEDQQLLSLRSEVSALRMLQLPGVARLLDEGMHGERPFLTMEKVAGRPFPGRRGPLTWESIGGTVIALLETLARVHAKGVVHRDLKPGNVLVDDVGRPTVLDFGLAAGSGLGSLMNPDRTAVGTPAYVSPEQIRGQRADARSDLYSLGVMIYEVLAGHGPQRGKVPDQILQMRLHEPAPLLAEVAPEVPPFIAQVVDKLLAREPRHRPRSANEVLRRLRGESSTWTSVEELPWLGKREPIRRLVQAARERRSVDLVGERGSGRTRCLREVESELSREGYRVVWLVPECEPFASLEPLGEWLDEEEPETLERAKSMTERLLHKVLADGVVLIADERDAFDRWSVDVLERCRDVGCILLARLDESGDPDREVLRLENLEEEELRALFAGPDRLFHLREDAARELWLRTGGHPARVVDEVAAWVRADLARWAALKLAVDRQALDRLRTGLRVLPPVQGSQSLASPLSQNLEELLAWIALASPHATPEILAALWQRPAWIVEAELFELIEINAARRTWNGRIELLVAPRRPDSWTDEQRREAHSRIARVLEPGTEGRLLHLVAAGELKHVADEARKLARHMVRAGRLGEAEAALAEGLHATRQLGDAFRECLLFREWIPVALADFTPLALDRVLYELSRALERSDEVVHLERFVHAAVTTLESDGERSLAELEAVAPFADPELERWRQAMRVQAARGCSFAREEAVLAEISEWAESHASGPVRASLAEWMGRLRYRQERFEEAAKLHAQAAELSGRTSARLSAMLNGASALMEACRFEEVRELARRACALAATCRHPYFEARAEWLLRSADYRSGCASEPDPELVEAAGRVGARDQEALICLTEAAVAWRQERLDLARDLANRAWHGWTAAGRVWGGHLARALALACGAEPDEREIEGLALRAEHCPDVEIAGQILCLLRRAGAKPRSTWIAVGDAIRDKFPRETGSTSTRREVLSVAEVVEALGS